MIYACNSAKDEISFYLYLMCLYLIFHTHFHTHALSRLQLLRDICDTL